MVRPVFSIGHAYPIIGWNSCLLDAVQTPVSVSAIIPRYWRSLSAHNRGERWAGREIVKEWDQAVSPLLHSHLHSILKYREKSASWANFIPHDSASFTTKREGRWYTFSSIQLERLTWLPNFHIYYTAIHAIKHFIQHLRFPLLLDIEIIDRFLKNRAGKKDQMEQIEGYILSIRESSYITISKSKISDITYTIVNTIC